ncbi:Adenylosuccinate synthetase [Frankliniella fusca]|uniref:Adenylosuccinate synthetase n=1 Tax=Frankliniella fusca TaxID=407009 RepID=A0AAE1I3S5_9NEOP|nr:Adenylosuccinate synthetase [Frankliniella fusca]
MSLSGGVMTNAALDAALDNLGMLSTAIVNRPQVVDDQIPRLAALSIDDILQNSEMGSRSVSSGGKQNFITENGFAASADEIACRPMRRRVKTISCSSNYGKARMAKMRRREMVHPYSSVESQGNILRRSRTRSENESERLDHLSQCSPLPQSYMDPVPFIAFPLDGEISSNLFKSRSMESIDARTSDESVGTCEKDALLMANASFAEVDEVSGGLHKLNVSE